MGEVSPVDWIKRFQLKKDERANDNTTDMVFSPLKLFCLKKMRCDCNKQTKTILTLQFKMSATVTFKVSATGF